MLLDESLNFKLKVKQTNESSKKVFDESSNGT